jgi:hypothetical protein
MSVDLDCKHSCVFGRFCSECNDAPENILRALGRTELRGMSVEVAAGQVYTLPKPGRIVGLASDGVLLTNTPKNGIPDSEE